MVAHNLPTQEYYQGWMIESAMERPNGTTWEVSYWISGCSETRVRLVGYNTREDAIDDAKDAIDG